MLARRRIWPLLDLLHVAQGAASCWFSRVGLTDEGSVGEVGQHESRDEAPLSTLLALERTIQQRQAEAGSGAQITLKKGKYRHADQASA